MEPDNELHIPFDEEGEWDYEEGENVFICNRCGKTYSESEGEDYDSTRLDKLLLIFNPYGFPLDCLYHCSVKCIQEETAEYEKLAKEQYGDTCAKCDKKIGEHFMKPCCVCGKVICYDDSEKDKHYHYCSAECAAQH